MRKILALIWLLLFFTVSASATLTVTKLGVSSTPSSVATSNCPETGTPSVNTCWSLTVTSTTSGAGLIGIVLFNNTGDNFAGATPKGCFDGGDTFANAPAAFHSTGSGGGTGLCYILSVTGAKTTIFASNTGSTQPVFAVYQVTFTNSPFSFDNSTSTTVASSTSFSGASPTVSGTSEVIFQAAVCGQTCGTPCGSGWTCDFTAGDGTAYKVTTSASITWTQSPAGTAVVAGASFKEASASSPTAPAQVYLK